ncbi:MAG: hypothetical protein ACXWJW_05815 [Xanthobacteraceae bacterium]
MTTFKKLISAAALGASLVAGLAPAASANDTGAFLGGLAAGAIVGGAIAGGRPAPVYVAPAPVYGPPVYYQRRCWYEAQPVFNQFGYQVGSQTVQRCN